MQYWAGRGGQGPLRRRAGRRRRRDRPLHRRGRRGARRRRLRAARRRWSTPAPPSPTTRRGCTTTPTATSPPTGRSGSARSTPPSPAAERIVTGEYTFPRYSSTPMECYSVIAEWRDEPDGPAVEAWANFHGPFSMVPVIAGALGLPMAQLRLHVPPDIGGSFGIKAGIYPYVVLMALASKHAGRPVRWTEDRIEHLLASSAGTDRADAVRGGRRRAGAACWRCGSTWSTTSAPTCARPSPAPCTAASATSPARTRSARCRSAPGRWSPTRRPSGSTAASAASSSTSGWSG